MRVLTFGDSITYGAWDSQGGWPDRIKRELHIRSLDSQGAYKAQLLNLGIGGDTSSKILARLETEIIARYSPNWPLVLVFAFCTNDERISNGRLETELERFRQNVLDIIKIARKHTDKILFVGMPPLSAPTIVFKEQAYSDQRINQYDAAMRTIVEQAGITFVPIRPLFEAPVDELFSFDGLHPNDAGHALIAEAVLPKLTQVLQ